MKIPVLTGTLIGVFLLNSTTSADVIESMPVIQLSPYSETERKYSCVADQPVGRKMTFDAKKQISLDGTSSWFFTVNSDEAAGDRDEQIVGEHGLLLQCLERFLQDEPNAINNEINAVEFYIDLRASNAIWAGVKKELTPFLKHWNGVVSGVEVEKRKKLLFSIRDYVASSEDVKKIANMIGKKLHCAQDGRIGASCEALTFDPQWYNKPWSDLMNSPHLGISMRNICVAIRFKPQKQRSLFIPE